MFGHRSKLIAPARDLNGYAHRRELHVPSSPIDRGLDPGLAAWFATLDEAEQAARCRPIPKARSCSCTTAITAFARTVGQV